MDLHNLMDSRNHQSPTWIKISEGIFNEPLPDVRVNVTTAGKHCYNGGVLSRSIEWFEEAWMLAGEERNKSVSQDQVQQVTIMLRNKEQGTSVRRRL